MQKNLMTFRMQSSYWVNHYVQARVHDIDASPLQ